MKIEVTVEYDGIEFEVRGNWEKGYAETRLEPGEPAGFDECYIYHCGEDITEVLASGVVDSIIDRATESYIRDSE